MYAFPQDRVANVLLRSLPARSFDWVAPHLKAVSLPARFKLSEPGKDCEWVYFPESGIASVLGRTGVDWQEIGLFGKEGAGCLSVILGQLRSPYVVVMQVPGRAYRVSAHTIAELFRTDEQVRDLFLRYTQAVMMQLTQTCIANAQFNTVQRMARWFLMVHDRVEGDTISLTHEFIAMMLGVGRTGVTLALHALENARLISTARKRIVIVDRHGLEAMTSVAYGVAEAEYERLLGPTRLPPAHASVA